MRVYAMVAVLALAGCDAIRDPAVYSTEVQFIDMVVQRQAPTVRSFLEHSCSCSGDAEWTATVETASNEECMAAADWYRVYAARWSWHVAMIRYNGRVSDTDPGPVPEVPVSCELPEVPATSGGES